MVSTDPLSSDGESCETVFTFYSLLNTSSFTEMANFPPLPLYFLYYIFYILILMYVSIGYIDIY